MTRALIINAHQYYDWAKGELNAHLAGVIEQELQAKGFTVRHTRIDDGYDVQEEVEKHQWADLIILQTPVYWFGAPWTHKKYLDEVFNHAITGQTLITDDGRSRQDPSRQYGSGGNMQGKRFMMSLTWNAPAAAFGDQRQRLFAGSTDHDAFQHIANCYKFCGADILPTFSCFDVVKAPTIEQDVKRLEAHLNALIPAQAVTTEAEEALV
ncbi:NAD(P)H-dependent oxidoreductase [Oceanimonas smirnovii]|uniref:NAD(P)H-dependent oxidoreductase n=1 Tax=Oceanimonas smirnovii TaxID=264574 RepID=A0ABW7P318_9GAMM